ncbi:MAG: nucleotidyltransferase family protein [Flavobacteriaceae bacterium]|nr:nucleotidyltransferase family protein [Flavobacteriaceae bacterium]
MSKIGILILAAGSSSRMGEPKQLLPYRHTTLLGWAIEQAQASKADEILCVLGARAEEIETAVKGYGVKTIYNRNHKKGLSSSIISGVKELVDRDALLIMLADQPLVTSYYLNSLIYQYFEHPKNIISSTYGASLGVPAIFPQQYFDQLLDLKGDKGAKSLLNECASDVIKVSGINLIDVDLPEDYNKLKK